MPVEREATARRRPSGERLGRPRRTSGGNGRALRFAAASDPHDLLGLEHAPAELTAGVDEGAGLGNREHASGVVQGHVLQDRDRRSASAAPRPDRTGTATSVPSVREWSR